MKKERKFVFVGGCNHGNVCKLLSDYQSARIPLPEDHPDYTSDEELEDYDEILIPTRSATHCYRRAKLLGHDVFIGPEMFGEGRSSEFVTPDIIELLRKVDEENAEDGWEQNGDPP